MNRSAAGVSFEQGLVFAPKSNPRGYVKTNFGFQGVVVDTQIQTDASKVSSITFKKKNVLAKNLPGLNVSLAVNSSDKDFSAKPKYGFFSTTSADYTRQGFAATAAVSSDEDSNHSITASAAIGFDGFSVGGDVKLIKTADKSSLVAKSYNAGVAYQKKNYTGSLVSDAKFEKLKATLLAAKVGPDAQFTLGAQAKVDLQKPKDGEPQREVILSVEQKASKQTTYRLATVVTSGVIVGSVEHKLVNPSLTLSASVATAMPNSAFAPFAANKFGVNLAFGEN